MSTLFVSRMWAADSRVTPSEHRWLCPPAELDLLGEDVHVWRATLDQPAAHVQRLAQTLSADERARAGRFHFDRDRRHFIVSRGLLRVILSRYLDVEPSQLRFCYNPHGKPALASISGEDEPHFNLSYSHGLALYAITRDRQVGIDLEYIRPVPEVEQIVERFFSPKEDTAFCAIPPSEQLEAFFRCWTGKEAYIKARGQGFALPLDQFDVSLAPGEPATLLNIRGDALEVSRWSLQELIPGPGYLATLAVEGHGWRLACWEWPEW